MSTIRTIATLFLLGAFLNSLAAGDEYKIVFVVQPIKPKDDPSTPVNESLYESKVKVFKGKNEVASYLGSVFPDDMNTSGKIKDGEYELHLGFHRRSEDEKALIPTKDDLKVKAQGTLRPALIVAKDTEVPCWSDNPNKKTMKLIHVHNGFKTKRYSEGCLTITPDEWSKFIQRFLDENQMLTDWYKDGTYFSKNIGILVVEKATN